MAAGAKNQSQQQQPTASGAKTLVLDFSEVKSYEAMPEGRYVADITSVEVKTSANKNQYFQFNFEIAEGDEVGRKLNMRRNLGESSLPFLLETIEMLEMSLEDFQTCKLMEDGDKLLLVEPALAGTRVEVYVVQRSYENQRTGKKRQGNEVSDIVGVVSRPSNLE